MIALALIAVSLVLAENAFISGILQSLQIESQNECLNNLELPLEGVAKAFALLKSSTSASQKTEAVKVFGQGLLQIAHAFTVCGEFTAASKIESVGKDAQSGAVSIVDEQIFVGGKAVEENLHSAANVFDSDLLASGAQAGEVVAKVFGSASTAARQYLN